MSEPQAAPLGAEDYGALMGLLTSGDAGARSQGMTLAKKLTPDEQRAFFDYQQQVNPDAERHRPDNSVLGVPPELAVVSGLGLGRAVSGGVGLAGKAVAGAKEVVSQAEPILKYEVTKAGLMHMGVPAPIAIPIAMAISGYRGGKASASKAAAAEAAPVAEAPLAAAPASIRPNPVGAVSSPITPEEYAATFGHEMPANLRPSTAVAPAGPAAASAAPPASTPGPPAPVSASATPQSVQTPPPASGRIVMSPQRIQNELGLAAIRQKVTLSEPEFQQAADLVVKEGISPAGAVARMKLAQPPAMASHPVPAAEPAVSVAPAKLKLNMSEQVEYMRLRRGGMTHDAAANLIDQQRQLLKTFGTPSSEDVIRSVVDRNTTGRWQKE